MIGGLYCNFIDFYFVFVFIGLLDVILLKEERVVIIFLFFC